MKISIIIPTLNAQAGLADQLERLAGQKTRPHEIIVIDSESTDATARIAQQAGVRFMTIPRREFNHGGTRNLAASQAEGDCLVFLTQDALPVDDDLLTGLVEALENDGVALAYGRQVAYEHSRSIEKFVRNFNYPAESCIKDQADIPTLGVKTFFCSNACAAYRRGIFDELGGFRADTIMNEDMEFVYRAVLGGYRAAYAADARVWHSHDYTFFEQLRRYVDIGVFFTDNPDLAALSQNGGEGLRYVLQAARFLVERKKFNELPVLVTDTAARLLGYRLGKRYRLLPESWIRRVSMNRGYWNAAAEVKK